MNTIALKNQMEALQEEQEDRVRKSKKLEEARMVAGDVEEWWNTWRRL